jgi:UTP--glucose-1-phosphate uridylyltransferase
LQKEQILAYQYDGVRYDCGSKIGYLKATVEFALNHPEVRDEFAKFLQEKNFTPQ